MEKKLKDGSPEELNAADLRKALNTLIVDETEAVKGYDEVLSNYGLSTKSRAKLEEIRNEEIAHIVELSNIYKSLATGNIDENSKEILYGMDSIKVVNDFTHIYKTDKPNIKWRIHQAKSGEFYFKDPDGNTYKEEGSEVKFNSREAAGKFFIQKLFNKSLWGSEIPKVVVDSVVKDSLTWSVGSYVDKLYYKILYKDGNKIFNKYIGKYVEPVPNDRMDEAFNRATEQEKRALVSEWEKLYQKTQVKDADDSYIVEVFTNEMLRPRYILKGSAQYNYEEDKRHATKFSKEEAEKFVVTYLGKSGRVIKY